jgi:hypothetical protein
MVSFAGSNGMKRSTISVVLYLVLTFGSGVAVGGFATWLYSTRTVSASAPRFSPDEYRKRYISELNGRVHLSEEQVKSLTAIMDATRLLYREISDKHRPEYDAIFQHQNAQILKILSPEQQAEFEKFNQERAERRKQFRPGGQPRF